MDLTMETLASEGDGKKRRSFLPAPKKSSGLPFTASQAPFTASHAPFTASQAPFNDGMLQSQSSALPLASTVYSHDTPSIPSFLPKAEPFRGRTTVQNKPSRPAERVGMDRQVEECAFGVGLRVGARVRIGGIKPGVLRFLGTTHMAPGIFCGIELYDPDGNHNGEVNGHRYFTCAPNHGIFAPKEKVCLDTSGVLGRLESDANVYYSSSDRLSERTHNAFRSYEREFEQVDCPKSSLVRPHSAQYSQDFTPRSRDYRYSGKSSLPSQFSTGTGRSSEYIESRDFTELASKASTSGLARAGASILPTSSVQHKSSTFSPTHNMYGTDSVFYQRPPSYSSESDISGASSLEALAKNQGSATDFDSDQEHGRFSPRHSRERSSNVSDDNGFVRDTLSSGITQHLRAESKQDFTFDYEELNRCLEYGDSQRDYSVKEKDLNLGLGGAVTRNYDLHSQIVISDNAFGNLRSALTADSSMSLPDKTARAGANMGVLEADIEHRMPFPLSVSSDRSVISNTDTHTLIRNDVTHRFDIHASGSEAHKDDFNLFTTHTGSSKDLPQGMRPIDSNSLSAGFHACGDERTMKGGYLTKYNHYENGGGVNLSQPLDKCHNKNYMVSLDQTGAGLDQLQSYTVSTISTGKSDTPRDTVSENSSFSNIQPRINSSEEDRGNNLDDSSTGASSEVSQTLEWDYGQDFEGNIQPRNQDSPMSVSSSNGTSESLSDVHRDTSSEQSDDLLDREMISSLTDNSDQFQHLDEFENIDNVEDFSFLGKHSGRALPNSGISSKGCGSYPAKSPDNTFCRKVPDEYSREEDTSSRTTTRAISWDSSQETLTADTPGSVEDKAFLSQARCTAINIHDTKIMDSIGDRNLNTSRSLIFVENGCAMQIDEEKKKHFNRHFSSHEDISSSTDSNVMAKHAEASVSMGRRKEHAELQLDTYSKVAKVLNKEKRHRFFVSSTSSDPDFEEQEEGGKQRLSTELIPSKPILKTDDGDDSTGNTEDERIEADQVYGQDSKKTLGVAVDEALKCGALNEGDDVNDGDSKQTHQSADADKCLDSPSAASEEGETQEGNSLTKDGSSQQSNTRTRKHITITKKRSENVDHKMPNTNVTSKLADYIKAPVPVKPREDKEKEQKKKQNKNVKNASQKRASLTDIGNSKLDSRRPSLTDRDDPTDENVPRTKIEKHEKPKPIIKKTPRKSKWDEIMSQIEANKDTAKPKPMSEIKSSLAAYLNAPPPQINAADIDSNTDQRKREHKSKIKPLPPPPPKIDFSKIKSKLNVPTAASAIKAVPKREHSSKLGKTDKETTRENTAGVPAESTVHSATEDNREGSDGSIVLIMQPITDGAISVKSSHTDVSVCDNRDNAALPPTKGGTTSKGESLDLNKKENRRPSTQSLATEQLDRAKSTLDSPNKPAENQKRGTQVSSNHQQKLRISATTKATSHTNNTARPRVKLTGIAAQKEIERLESLCEARTKEVVHLKMQLTVTIQAFDAIAVLLNYSCNELKAFESPILAQKLEAAEKQLEDCASQIADLSSQKETLDANLKQAIQEKDEAARQTKEALDSVEAERNDHSRLTLDLNNTHSAALITHREELSAKYDETMNKLTQFYERQIELLRQDHERQVANITNEGKLEMNSLKISHLEETQELRNRHDDQMEELHKQHRNKLDDITLRFEAIKLSLSEKVDSLRKECDGLARRARESEEALQRDADVKVQIALSPYLSLPSEIESLKAVQEMRLEEIQKLRTKIMDLEKQLEEVPIARDKIISLQQKVDNLEAIINIKTEHEKQLHQKCQVLMRKYEREYRTNKRISMDFEQVMWQMSQSSELGSSESLTKRQFSQSSSHGEVSSDSQHHTVLPNGNRADGILRTRKRSSHSTSESDRKIRSRSATFLTERNESSDSPSPSLSPQVKQKRRGKKYHGREVTGEMDRMYHSAGPEILYDLLPDTSSQQAQGRKQSESTLLNDLAASQIISSSDMASSYARSLSGVSDSGIYDSLARSDILNSSMASTDSEWATSVNLLTTCESAVGDYESGPTAGDYELVPSAGDNLSLDDTTITEVKGPSL